MTKVHLIAVSFVVNSVMVLITYLLDRIAKCFTFVSLCSDKMPSGTLRQSFVIVLIATIQLCASVLVARAIIFFHLLTSRDVERNPGPVQNELDCEYFHIVLYF